MGLITPSEIREEVLNYFNTGGGKRYYLGLKDFDKNYGIREGSRTDWTGYPASGKTELCLELLWNCSNYYDHKHLVYMPDAGSIAETIAKLFHKITGKRMEKYYFDKDGKHEVFNRATTQEIDRHLPEILHYFKIYKPHPKELVTPAKIWNYAEQNQHELGIFGVIVDSWNNLYHDVEGMREDKWLAKSLQHGNTIVERTGLHFHTIVHPKTVKLKDGKVIMPTFHEIKGGSEWGNYGKSIITVHRDRNVDFTDISFEKVKGANIGVRGMTTLHYDVQAARYYEISNENGGQRRYAEKEPTQMKLQPNKEFES